MDFKKGSLEVMLKPRIIARMDIKNANLIKSINLEGLKIIGNPKIDLQGERGVNCR